MAITKKHSWVKGYWAFGFKIITPQGTTMEFEMPHVSESRGNAFWEKLGPMLGLKRTPDQCCERDHNHDGDCDKHPANGNAGR